VALGNGVSEFRAARGYYFVEKPAVLPATFLVKSMLLRIATAIPFKGDIIEAPPRNELTRTAPLRGFSEVNKVVDLV
jgi:hypothetical protein